MCEIEIIYERTYQGWGTLTWGYVSDLDVVPCEELEDRAQDFRDNPEVHKVNILPCVGKEEYFTSR